jgi:hypothetical protein
MRLGRGWIEEDVASDEWRDKKRLAARHETNESGDEALYESSGLHRRVWLARRFQLRIWQLGTSELPRREIKLAAGGAGRAVAKAGGVGGRFVVRVNELVAIELAGIEPTAQSHGLAGGPLVIFKLGMIGFVV